MRISTSQIQRQGVAAILEQQAKMAHTQLQIATGRRILRPSDDPAGAKQLLDLGETAAINQEFQKNLAAAAGRLGLEDSVLAGVTDQLHRFRELAVQGNSATLNDTDRRALAAEIRERLAGLIDLANTRDATNNALFAGYQTDLQAFVATPSGVVYNGDQGQRFRQVGPSVQVATGDSGADVFQFIRNGNGIFRSAENTANLGDGILGAGSVTDPSAYVADTYTITFLTASDYEVRDSALTLIASGVYTSGNAIAFNGIGTTITGAPAAGDSFTVSPSTYQDVFTTVQNLADALEIGHVDDAARGRFGNAVNRAIGDLDQALEHILDVRARVGGRLNALDSQQNVNEDLGLFISEAMSNVGDLDLVDAASRLQLELTAFQAAQQSYVRIQALSLFDLL